MAGNTSRTKWLLRSVLLGACMVAWEQTLNQQLYWGKARPVFNQRGNFWFIWGAAMS